MHKHGRAIEKKEMFRDEKVKHVRTYADVVSTGKLSNEREREVSILSKVDGCDFFFNNLD